MESLHELLTVGFRHNAKVGYLHATPTWLGFTTTLNAMPPGTFSHIFTSNKVY